MADIFVSYARADKARVAPLVDALEARGWSVWWDPAIVPGQEFDPLIRREIGAAKVVVVVWTPASVGSRWVRGEARLGADRGILVPVRFERAELPIDSLAVHTTDLDEWQGNADSPPFKELLSALLRHLNEVSRPAREARHRTSICVLPFTNMSGDSEQEYFADGISEDIITDLSKVSALSVIARNTAFTFKGRSVDVTHVARQLNVDHVLEGSVRRSGNRVRITAQLIHGVNGDHLWAERYDRDLSDIFALQDEVSHSVVDALKLKLFPEEKKAIENRGTDSVEAYDLYLRARSLASTLTGPEARRAVDLYRRALELDTTFAQAWAGVSTALGTCFIYYPETIATLRPEMEVATARAAELAPDLPEVLAAQALQSLTRYDWASVEGHLAKFAAINYTLGVTGYLLEALGRVREAVEARLKERRTDPLSLATSFGLQFALDIEGRFEESEAEYERCRDLPGNRASLEWRAVTRMMSRGDGTRLKQRLADFCRMDTTYQPFLPQLVAVLDEPQHALSIIRTAFDDPGYQDGARMGAIAHWAVLYGDIDLAFKALRRGYVDMHGLTMVEIWHPIFADLRKDPRFKDIVRDIGLAAHWRATGRWGDFARPLGDDDFEMTR